MKGNWIVVEAEVDELKEERIVFIMLDFSK